MQGLKEQINSEIAAGGVLMYSKSGCPYCVRAKALLNNGGVQFKLVELDQMSNGSTIQDTLQGISGQRTVPNIYINKQHVGGCSELQGLERSKKLGPMLTAAGIAHKF